MLATFPGVSAKYTLFLDLDGVLADFDAGVHQVTGKLPSELSPRSMWPRLAKTPGFYANLAWMPDGRTLWERVKRHDPVILTGLPLGKWARPQKLKWCARELGPDVEVLTCMSRDKAEVARSRAPDDTVPVLVDDRDRYRDKWEEMGGIFVHHKSAEESIARLEELGLDCGSPE
jgi:hypothetical protein